MASIVFTIDKFMACKFSERLRTFTEGILASTKCATIGINLMPNCYHWATALAVLVNAVLVVLVNAVLVVSKC